MVVGLNMCSGWGPVKPRSVRVSSAAVAVDIYATYSIHNAQDAPLPDLTRNVLGNALPLEDRQDAKLAINIACLVSGDD